MISLQLDSTLFIQMLQFIVITFLVSKFVVAPIKANMDKRDEKIESLNSEAKKAIESMEAKKAEYDAKLRQVNQEIAEFRNKLMQDAAKQAQDKIDAVNSEIMAETEKAKEMIRREAESAKKELMLSVDALAEDIIQSVSN